MGLCYKIIYKFSIKFLLRLMEKLSSIMLEWFIMNIGTSALLNILSVNLNSKIKEFITPDDTKSKFGSKSVGDNIAKTFFGMLQSGEKSKNDISTLIKNNSSSLISKTISQDIKLLTENLDEKNISPRIKELFGSIKDMLLDTKTLDQEALKSSIKNSGVMLESKLSKLSVPIKENIDVVIKQLDILQSNLKLENIELDTNSFVDDLVKVIDGVKTVLDEQNDSEFGALKKEFKQIIKQILNLKEQTTTKQLENIKNITDGLKTFQESITITQHKNTLNTNIPTLTKDIKAILLKVEDELETAIEQKELSDEQIVSHKNIKQDVQKVLSQIDMYQLLSYSTDSLHTYLPFIQNEFEDVDINFYHTQDDTITSQINLTLQHFDKLSIYLILDEQKTLTVNISVENQQFKKLIQNSLQTFRQNLNQIGVSIQAVNLFDLKDRTSSELNAYTQVEEQLDLGVEVKV